MKTPSFKRFNLILVAVISLAAITLSLGIVRNWPKGILPHGSPGLAEDTPSALISQLRPEFTMPDLSGAHRAIKEWDGKVLAINFWATWCGPCKEEIPGFNAIQKQYGPRGMQFVGVALDDAESVMVYLKSTDIEYPVLVGGEDESIKLATLYGDDKGVVPYTAFIDREGKIAFLHYGAISPDLTREIIESLL